LVKSLKYYQTLTKTLTKTLSLAKIDFFINFRLKHSLESKPAEPAKPLKLNEKYADCDWHKDENSKCHRTTDFSRDDDSLIVRRGQPFKFTARLNRPFDSENDIVKLDLKFGPSPSVRVENYTPRLPLCCVFGYILHSWSRVKSLFLDKF